MDGRNDTQTLAQGYINVEVTDDDIEQGVMKNRNECPISLAINRVTGYRAHVYNKNVYVNIERGVSLVGELPDNAGEFIRIFDTHAYSKPITFRLDLSIY